MIRTVIHSLGFMALAGIFLLVPVMAFVWSCPVGSATGINSTATITGVGGGAMGVGAPPAVSGSPAGPEAGGGAAGLPAGSGGKEPNAKPVPSSPPLPGGMGGYDPTKDTGMPTGTREQSSRAGQETGPSAGGTLAGKQPNQGKGEGVQQPGTYTEKPGGAQATKGSEGSAPPLLGYGPDGGSLEGPPGRVTVDSLSPGSKGSRGRPLAPPKGSTTGGGASSGGTGPAAPATVPGATAPKPPAQTPPTAQAPAAGADRCANLPPLCKDNCQRSCRAMGYADQLCGCEGARECNKGEPIAKTDAEARAMCYVNMLKRCEAGCVSPGKGTCVDKAYSVCHCDKGPGCSGRAEQGGDGPWHAWAQDGTPLAGMLLPALLYPECRTPN